MNPKYEILFPQTKIGSVEIKNRFVMCAMESTGAAALRLSWFCLSEYSPCCSCGGS